MNQKGWDIILCRFIQKLGKKCPDLVQFDSSELFDHIVGHKFIPGDLFNTCHHGMSILAVRLCSFTMQEHKQCEDDYYQEASNKTQDVIRKHKMKGPPALPTSISKLLLLLDQLIVLTKGLFSVNSPMATQLQDLQLTLQKWHHTLIGDSKWAAELSHN